MASWGSGSKHSTHHQLAGACCKQRRGLDWTLCDRGVGTHGSAHVLLRLAGLLVRPNGVCSTTSTIQHNANAQRTTQHQHSTPAQCEHEHWARKPHKWLQERGYVAADRGHNLHCHHQQCASNAGPARLHSSTHLEHIDGVLRVLPHFVILLIQQL
jgi:hypothetical protein